MSSKGRKNRDEDSDSGDEDEEKDDDEEGNESGEEMDLTGDEAKDAEEAASEFEEEDSDIGEDEIWKVSPLAVDVICMQRLITSVPGHASQHASSWWGR